jgi:hypothetical protein
MMRSAPRLCVTAYVSRRGFEPFACAARPTHGLDRYHASETGQPTGVAIMNAFTLTAAVVAFAPVAALVAARFYRGPLPRSQFFVIVLLAVAVVGGAAANLALVDQRDGGSVRERVQAVAAHTADLKRRIEANVAAMQATLAEPQTSKQPPSVERDRAWRDRVASLAHEAQALAQERDDLAKQIDALQPDVAASRDSIRRMRLVLLAVVFAFVTIGSLAVILSARKRIAKARAARMSLPVGEPIVASDRVKRLAAAGRRIVAVQVYREETGAGLVEALNAVDNLRAP